VSQQINLYNPLLLKQQKLFSLNTMAQALGLILLGIFLFYGYAWYRVADLEKQMAETARLHRDTLAQLEQTKSKLGPRKASKLLEDEVTRMEAQVDTRRRIIGLMEQGELGNSQGFSEYFRAFARQTMDGLWLTGFRVSGSGDMAISGRALKPEQVPVFINHLKREKILEGKTFTTLEMRLPPATSAPEGKPVTPAFIEFSLHNTDAGGSR
jgi:hypothetical protein